MPNSQSNNRTQNRACQINLNAKNLPVLSKILSAAQLNFRYKIITIMYAIDDANSAIAVAAIVAGIATRRSSFPLSVDARKQMSRVPVTRVFLCLEWSVLWLHIIFAPYRVTKRRGLWSFTIYYMKARVSLFEMSRRAKSGPRISRKYPAVAESQARVKQRRCQNRLWQGLNPKGNEKKNLSLIIAWIGDSCRQ